MVLRRSFAKNKEQILKQNKTFSPYKLHRSVKKLIYSITDVHFINQWLDKWFGFQPIEKIRAGYKTDAYFNRSKYILERDGRHPRVTMQVFQKVPNAVVCGIDHALAILVVGTGYYVDSEVAAELFKRYLELEQEIYLMWRNLEATSWNEFIQKQKALFNVSRALDRLWHSTFEELTIDAVYDGEVVDVKEPVMLISGDLSGFVHLETLYPGALTDGTMVATNTRDCVEAANGKPILMFGARHQSAESQAGSGYAAYVGGAKGISTDEQGEWWGSKGLGTIPHALIAAYDGDTVEATRKFDRYVDPKVVRVSLVDFWNDSVNTSLQVAHALGKRLGAVRLDTSENMIDICLETDVRSGRLSETEARGVNPDLVLKVRNALDREGFSHVGIFVSGGFNPEKIRRFEELKLPVAGYGVGSYLFDRRNGKFEYTADVVMPVAKAGRGLWPAPKVVPVNLQELILGRT